MRRVSLETMHDSMHDMHYKYSGRRSAFITIGSCRGFFASFSRFPAVSAVRPVSACSRLVYPDRPVLPVSDTGFVPVGFINDVNILILQILPAGRLRRSWDDDRKT